MVSSTVSSLVPNLMLGTADKVIISQNGSVINLILMPINGNCTTLVLTKLPLSLLSALENALRNYDTPIEYQGEHFGGRFINWSNKPSEECSLSWVIFINEPPTGVLIHTNPSQIQFVKERLLQLPVIQGLTD